MLNTAQNSTYRIAAARLALRETHRQPLTSNRVLDTISAMTRIRSNQHGESDQPGGKRSSGVRFTGNTTKKALLIAAGSVSVALGVVGIFLPLLPTVPFLLLAAFLYARSSQRLYNWLINHRVLGVYIYDYVTYRSVRLSVKVGTLSLLWLTLTVSILLVSNLYVRILLLAVGCGVSIHVLTLKTPVKKGPGDPHRTDDSSEQ